MDQLKEAILKTIEYGRNFGAEYGDEEIEERLISEKKYPDREVVAKLREMKWPEIGKTNNKILINKVEKAKKLGEQLAEKFRDILMIGITGSVAAGCPKENEDIDLMIITKKDSLWVNRLGMKIWTWKNKIPRRKYGVEQKKDEFCFNLWLEEGSLRMPKNRQNLKNAMDLILMKPIINKNNIYEKFIGENTWAKKYVANGYNKKNLSALRTPLFNKRGRAHFGVKSVINWVVFELQYVYMKRKLTAETVDPKRAFFHPKK
jgi:hypothetical protein